MSSGLSAVPNRYWMYPPESASDGDAHTETILALVVLHEKITSSLGEQSVPGVAAFDAVDAKSANAVAKRMVLYFTERSPHVLRASLLPNLNQSLAHQAGSA